MNYAYAVGNVRALENNLLQKSDFESLISAKSIRDAEKILKDKGYGQGDNFEEILSDKLCKTFEIIRKIAPSAPVNILIYKNDFHNLKVALKALFSGEKEVKDLFLYPVTVDTDLMQRAVLQKEFSHLPEMLSKVAETGYESLSKLHDGCILDSLVDRYCMEFILNEAEKCKSLPVLEYVRHKIYAENMKIFRRGKRVGKKANFFEIALLANFEEGGFYEKDFEERFIERAKFISLGPEPLLAYILKVEKEIEKIRLILCRKALEED